MRARCAILEIRMGTWELNLQAKSKILLKRRMRACSEASSAIKRVKIYEAENANMQLLRTWYSCQIIHSAK